MTQSRSPFDPTRLWLPERPEVVTRRLALSGLVASAAYAAGGGALAQTFGLGGGGGPLEVTVTGGQFRAIPIALPRFVVSDPLVAELADEIGSIVAADLERSDMFRLVALPPLGSIDIVPDFAGLRAAGIEALVAGAVGYEPDGRLGMSFRLWDIARGELLEQLKFLSDKGGRRRVAHKLADVVYSKLTGEDPYFDSRVAFVEESGPKEARRRQLVLMDQDGDSPRPLTDGSAIVLTPRFSRKDQLLTYISFETGEPAVYLLDLATNRKEIVSRYQGMSFAPRFSPDGRGLVFSLSRGASTDIVHFDIATSARTPLTNSPGIDTAPSYSHDGTQIVFESDRSLTQQLYIMNADGSNQQRLTFGEGRYATPVWSPKGDFIAFTKLVGGNFHIGVIRPDGSDERLLTSSFHDEAPTWAPNSRVLMFFRETRGPQGLPRLYTVDLFGRPAREVPTPYGASDPAWSPLLA